jgi:hypothetical protein
MQVGDLINYGTALVLHTENYIVLCFDINKKEFINWAVDDAGETFSGHYFSCLFSAIDDYEKRVSKSYF